jgi:hypothetical protein
MTDSQLFQYIANGVQQIDSFLLLMNYVVQITLGCLLGMKLGDK